MVNESVDGLLLSEGPSSMILNVQQMKSLPMEQIANYNHTQTRSRCEDDGDDAEVDIGGTYSSVVEHSLIEEESGSVDGHCANDNNDDLSFREELEQALSTSPPLAASSAHINGCDVVLERRGPHLTATAVNADKSPLLVESPAEHGYVSDIVLLEVSALEASNVDVLVGPQRECNTFVRISYVAPLTLIGENKDRKGGENNHNTMLRCKAPIHVTDVAERQHNPKWKKTSFPLEVHHGGISRPLCLRIACQQQPRGGEWTCIRWKKQTLLRASADSCLPPALVSETQRRRGRITFIEYYREFYFGRSRRQAIGSCCSSED